MKRGALLTHEQCSALAGKFYKDLNHFIYDQDQEGNFYLTEEQILACDEEAYFWIKELPIVEYV